MDIYALSGGGQGSFGVASGMDINSGKWDHDIGFFSHRGRVCFIEGTREAYIHKRRELREHKYWEAGVNCL